MLSESVDKETLLSDSLQNRLAHTEGYQKAEMGEGDTWRGTQVMVEAVMRWMPRTVGSCSILSSSSVSRNPRIVSRKVTHVAFVTCSVFFPFLGHSMMDTLAVALRVAEEAIEEAISKAESHGDSLVGPPSYGGARTG